jgi:hypothetical protein
MTLVPCANDVLRRCGDQPFVTVEGVGVLGLMTIGLLAPELQT